LKLVNRRHEDFERYYGSAFKRYTILKQLERANYLETNFIKNIKYLGGEAVSDEKINAKKIYFQNMHQSHYILCFRGWGNFSLRLYETLSAGRIPVIISSDNNLPFTQKINWNLFPVIDNKNINHIAEYISDFHASISEENFTDLQLKARDIWEEFITYQGFMSKIVDQYLVNISR
jgi:hypothetical protein